MGVAEARQRTLCTPLPGYGYAQQVLIVLPVNPLRNHYSSPHVAYADDVADQTC